MKPNYIFTLLIAICFFSFTSIAQTARVQAIHNSADAAAAVVDVYIFTSVTGDQLLLEDFAFRTASPFVDAPAGIPITLKVTTPGGSPSTPVYEITTTLSSGSTYILVADGIVSTSGYMPAQPFGIQVYDMGREAASTSGNTDVLVHHGATDAPTVDVNLQSGGTPLVDDVSYTEFAGYLELPTDNYAINVSTADGTTIVKAYDAPLATLGLTDSAITVVASGFLDPSMNSNGAAFGLYAATPAGGDLVALPESSARVQVIHNSADAAAASVDVYLNDALLIDDFAFRTASSFIDAPAGVPLSIEVAPGTSTSSMDAIYELPATLVSGETYILVADGIVSASGYMPAQPFGIQVYTMGREAASTSGNTDVLVHHGATDAPTVDVNLQSGGAPLVDDVSYTEFAGYLQLPTDDYAINVSTADGSTIVKAYDAPLATLGLTDSAITVVASGFLDPSMNSNGAAFGLYAATPAGGDLVALPESSARVQVIHNSADAAAASVDVYLNDALLIDDFAFRTASSFIDAPAGVPLSIEVAPGTSTSSMDAIYELPATLVSGETYILVADGIVSASGYMPAQAFGIQVYAMGREAASTSGNTDVLVHHGATDAPTVDVNLQSGGAPLVDDVSYTEFAGYLELPTDDYQINISTADGATIVQGYDAPLATLNLDDAAITVVASGFLDPSMNSNGAAFGLWVALEAGGPLVELPTNTLSIREFVNVDQLAVYPNPSIDGDLFISLPQLTEDIDAFVYDISGREVIKTVLSNELTKLDVRSLNTGFYIMTLRKGNDSFSVKIAVN
ncbi:DUF4397 domain-containing protein [uncultured Aquimarina sp.]|uniref:DUF4397 domain-containing protein n=1 Tax=uncultured Aquimarina sp. TaxID=575652 RepID=UPI0026369843|nr:DUF4397 domain-containing protein [uncultured Aquimarina sp.]